MRVEINSFFLSRYNLLSKSDHENNLGTMHLGRNDYQDSGLEDEAHTSNVIDAKRQVRVLELIDLFGYVVFATAGGKDPTALWNKMFVNIGNIPGSRKFGWFWNQITNLKSTSLDEEAYKMFCQMWRHVESTFQHLRTSLQGNLSLLALKFYMRLCEKKRNLSKKTTPSTSNPSSRFLYSKWPKSCLKILPTITSKKRIHLGRICTRWCLQPTSHLAFSKMLLIKR